MTRLHLSTRNLLEDLRASFWALPVAGLLLAVILATVAHALDRARYASVGPDAAAFTGATHVDTVRQLLATLATAAAGVTGIVFSVTITTLALASQQFGPHVLRTYMQRRFVQLVLAAFVGTVLYAMLALHWLGAAENLDYLPVITVATTLLLTGLDLVLLVLFVHATATSIQVGSLIEAVHEDHVTRLGTLFPDAANAKDPAGAADGDADAPPTTGGAIRITAADDGYLQSVDRVRLVDLGARLDLCTVMAYEAGNWVMAGATLATVHAIGSTPDQRSYAPDGRTPAQFEQRLRRMLVLGRTPTPEQDPRFALRQLQQIALRALSPALNDPQTAAACIARIGAIAADLMRRRNVRRHFPDRAGTVRLVEHRSSPGDLLDFAFDAVVRAGGERADTASDLLHTLQDLSERCTASPWLARLDEQLLRIERALADAPLDISDRERLDAAIRRAHKRITASGRAEERCAADEPAGEADS